MEISNSVKKQLKGWSSMFNYSSVIYEAMVLQLMKYKSPKEDEFTFVFNLNVIDAPKTPTYTLKKINNTWFPRFEG
jgi:hypothetical protein